MSDVDFEPIIGRYLSVDVEGAAYRVHVEEAGQGIPLLCLHTAGSDGRQYRALLCDAEITRDFRVVVFDMPWPLAVWMPEVKKYFISNMPCGVCMNLFETARLTVVSCTPTTCATCTIVMGLRNATPLSMNSRCRCTISRPMFRMVCWR